jgi:carbamoyl-phosphate synthase small subunit
MKGNLTPAVLILEDGSVFHGEACGAIGTTTGEIAFNTAMTGYQEVFTDPSYHGQILVMATAHIGNYGVQPQEIESDRCQVAGIVIKKFSQIASRAGNTASLQDLLERDGISGICEIDTRALVHHIREKGAMNCIISSDATPIEELQLRLKKAPSMAGLELASHVSTARAYEILASESIAKVAVLDFGVKQNILRCLLDRGLSLKVFPHNTKAEEILSWNPDGIMYSNGPGDPDAMVEVVQEVKKLVQSGIPGFGICLGHQLIALSQGLKTAKMFNGHRGINHPVKNILTGKSEITSQNHGFVVTRESIATNDSIEITHEHLNDQTVAGIRIKNFPVFSVQYHPEASAGPHDSRYLFDQFTAAILAVKKEVV